ncbi:hypothetical protein CFK39_10350 [Brachybacterium avium]|uniref:Competence protein CoiA nuclease-like domain-containing protein n=1 Tax=Brachybacterium avium TaxID=2017485 RepID=A0A220UE04_9MICO|nr:hypothetical protein CFK39_10350 [Brachybacterium avium]
MKAGYVECVFEGCGPYNHVRGGANQHATFVHDEGKSFQGHAERPETADHLHSKAALLAWARSAYPDDVVHFDLDTANIAMLAEGGKPREQRPDAWIALSSGAQIAIEFQHSVGDFERVREKTRRYEQQGITVWWVFSGRSPATCRNVQHAKFSTKYGELTADLSPAQVTLVGQAARFFWFDVERRRIATPMVPTRRSFRRLPEEEWSQETQEPITTRTYWGPPLKGYSRWARMYEHDLEQCRVDLKTGRLVTPGTQVWDRDLERAEDEIATLRQAAHQRYLDSCVESEAEELSVSSGWMNGGPSAISSQSESAVRDDDLSAPAAPSPSPDSSAPVPTGPGEEATDPIAGNARAHDAEQGAEWGDPPASRRAVSGDPVPPPHDDRPSWWRRAWQWLVS